MTNSPSVVTMNAVDEDALTTRIKKRRSSSIRKLSNVSLNGLNRFWRKSIFGGLSFGSQLVVGSGLPFDEVRDRVLHLIQQQFMDVFEEEFDAKDVHKAHHNNWFIQRFVIDRMEMVFLDEEDLIDDSAKGVIDCLKWRRDEKVNQLTASDFPKELYESGIVTLGKDVQGHPVIFIRSSVVAGRKCPEWHELIKMFISFCYEMVDVSLEGRTCGLVIDFGDCGISNFDLDFHIHVLEIVSKFYPMSCNFIYINNVFWLMRPGMSLLIRIMPSKYQKMVSFTNNQSLVEHLGNEVVPHFLGGKGRSDISLMAASAPTIESVAGRHRISQESTTKMKEHLLLARESMVFLDK